MTPEEYRDMLYAQIEASVKRQIDAPPQTLEKFTRDVQRYVMDMCEEHGNPADVHVELQFDPDTKVAEFIVTDVRPAVDSLLGLIVSDESKEEKR